VGKPGLTCGDRANIIGAMFTPDDLDDPEQVLAYLEPPIRAVHASLDHGVSLADAKMSDLDFDPHLWAHLVRYGARQRLLTLDPDDWHLGRELRNSGIEVVRGPLVVRTLKSQGDDPPSPGTSHAKMGFWSQRQTRLALVVDGVVFPNGANLILDWSATVEREIRLALSKPYAPWNYRRMPRIQWRRRVLIVEGEELRFDSAEEDIDVQPRFDPDEIEPGGEEGGADE
jgi:hypothetical protein